MILKSIVKEQPATLHPCGLDGPEPPLKTNFTT